METILKHQTLMGILTDTATRYPADSDRRWAEINPLWGRGSTQLIANFNIKFKCVLVNTIVVGRRSVGSTHADRID
jgi:hypothetical protein